MYLKAQSDDKKNIRESTSEIRHRRKGKKRKKQKKSYEQNRKNNSSRISSVKISKLLYRKTKLKIEFKQVAGSRCFENSCSKILRKFSLKRKW